MGRRTAAAILMFVGDSTGIKVMACPQHHEQLHTHQQLCWCSMRLLRNVNSDFVPQAPDY